MEILFIVVLIFLSLLGFNGIMVMWIIIGLFLSMMYPNVIVLFLGVFLPMMVMWETRGK